MPAPLLEHLVIYASAVCNARCTMCDVGRASEHGIARALRDAPPFFPRPLLTKLLTDPLVAEKKPPMNVYFIMTEPLLAPELPAMLAEAAGRGHACYVTTNGWLLAERAADIVPHLKNIQVSIDAPAPVHDAIRGPGFHARALQGIRAARALSDDLEIVVNATITPQTAPHLETLAGELDALGARIDVLKVQGMDFVTRDMREAHNAEHPDILQSVSTEAAELGFAGMDFEALAASLGRLRRARFANIGRVVRKPPFETADELRRYYDPAGAPMPGWKTCRTPWMALAVSTAGRAFFHTRCFNDYALGDLNDSTLSEVFLGPAAERFRAELAADGYCFPACARCCGVNPTV